MRTELGSLVSISEANRNFSNITKKISAEQDVVIIKNNRPAYAVVDYERYCDMLEKTPRNAKEDSIDLENMMPISQLADIFKNEQGLVGSLPRKDTPVIRNDKIYYIMVQYNVERFKAELSAEVERHMGHSFTVTALRRRQRKVTEYADNEGMALIHIRYKRINMRYSGKCDRYQTVSTLQYYVLFTLKEYAKLQEADRKNSEDVSSALDI